MLVWLIAAKAPSAMEPIEISTRICFHCPASLPNGPISTPTNSAIAASFGAEAKKLAERYWIRSTSSNETTINLEAYPRRQADAANYDRVDVILDRKTMQPTAIQVHLPGGQQRHVYTFHDATVNGKLEAWFGGLFSAPRTPLGWKKVVVQDGGPGAAPQAANPDAGVQR